MKIYNYHPVSGEYLGESFADESPLEPGIYLIPAHATVITPPSSQEGKYIAFQNTSWVYMDIPVEPEPEPLTTAQKLAALDAEYEPQRIELERYLFRAKNVWQYETESERQDTIISILSEMDALELEYNTKAEAIWNGQ